MYVNYGVGIATMVGAAGPVQIGGIQDISCNIKFTSKKAYGNLQFPIAVARGEASLTWKSKSIMFSGATIAAVLTGSSTATGNITPAVSEPHTVPATTTYTCTVTHGADFDRDLGVFDVLAGVLMVPVTAGSEAAGKYSVSSAGVYTFAVADASKVLTISYAYKVAASGHTTTYDNQLMGSGATISLDLFNPNPNQLKPMGIKIFATIVDGLDLTFKNTEFTTSDYSGEAFADASGHVFETYYVD